MKITPVKTQLNQVSLSYDEADKYILSNLRPSDIKNAIITVCDEGTTVTWIKPVFDLKYWILLTIEGTTEIVCIILLIMLFWFYGVDILQFKGVL